MQSLDSLYSQAIPVNFHKGDASKKMSRVYYLYVYYKMR